MPRLSLVRLNKQRAEAANRAIESADIQNSDRDAEMVAFIVAKTQAMGLDIASVYRIINTSLSSEFTDFLISALIKKLIFKDTIPLPPFLGAEFHQVEQFIHQVFWPVIKIIGFVGFYQLNSKYLLPRVIDYHIQVAASNTQSLFDWVPSQIRLALAHANNSLYCSEHLIAVKRELIESHQEIVSKKVVIALICYITLLIRATVALGNFVFLKPNHFINNEQNKFIVANVKQDLVESCAFVILMPILAMLVIFLQSIYRNIGIKSIVENLLGELNQHFSINSQHQWQHLGHGREDTIIYMHFDGKKIAINLGDEIIELSEATYFSELAIVFIESHIDFMVIRSRGLYISLQSFNSLLLQEIKANLIRRLKKFGMIHKIHAEVIAYLNQLNHTYGYSNEWSEIIDDQGNWSVFNSDKIDKFPPALQAKLIELFPQIHTTQDLESIILTIVNPQIPLVERQMPEVSSASLEPTVPAVAYAATNDLQFPDTKRGKIAITSRIRMPTQEVPKPLIKLKEQIIIDFFDVGLKFDSTLTEQERMVQPMYATWLPSYCHFSYLDPQLKEYLQNQGLLPRVLAILQSGRTYPSGILPSKLGGVGIVQSEQAYNNIQGKHFISRYKIKLGHYRLPARIYSVQDCYRLYIFDGIHDHGH